MQVFLSWSGPRSKALAESFASWISQVIQAVEPWVSSDIEKGTRWSPEIATRLEHSRVGIICLTKENLESNWILFEAGALSKTKDAYVCTFLLGVSPSDVKQPLGQFQHTVCTDKEDVHQLVRTINGAVKSNGEKALGDAALDEVFEVYWPRLSSRIASISEEKGSRAGRRSEREMLEEILETVRGQGRRLDSLAAESLFARDQVQTGAFRVPLFAGKASARLTEQYIRKAMRLREAATETALADLVEALSESEAGGRDSSVTAKGGDEVDKKQGQ